MGFNVQGGKEAPIDEAKVAGRIESQLQGLRDLYRQETSKNSALMGGLVLQLTVSSSGKVTKVREITSRIGDNDFRTAVIADAWTWSFDQVLSEESTIICPLLFVREGMDITTLIQWEKSLSQPGDRTSRAKMNLDIEPAPQITAVRIPTVRQTSSKRDCRRASSARAAAEAAIRSRRRALSNEVYDGDSGGAQLFGCRSRSLYYRYESYFAGEKRRLV